MSYFARPDWAKPAIHSFSGSISIGETELTFPLERAYYPGENLFPAVTLEFVSHEDELIPLRSQFLVQDGESGSLWNVLVGTGATWYEEEDGAWSRASVPLSLTDNYIGQVRNCVATFVFTDDSISRICLQCSQETADWNDEQVGDIRAVLPATYRPGTSAASQAAIEKRLRTKASRLPVSPLSDIDANHALSDYFGKPGLTRAPTSLGAVVLDGVVYLHPPRTRHGDYPYPGEMRHAVYSVTKSMTGALALFHFAQRYGESVFEERITDHVPALAAHPGWQGVTFSNTLNMVTGTQGGEGGNQLYEVLIKARSAEEAIGNIAGLGDASARPGEAFHYASTNLFVLSCALQGYVEKREGPGVSYWDLIRDDVLIPMGLEDFSLRRTVEADGSAGLPILGYGAWPTLDEAAQIALLFSREGIYQGRQLLHPEKCREALGRSAWSGYATGNEDRGSRYRHSFWSEDVRAHGCNVDVTYMLGYGGNYVWFFPSGAVALRFMDEYDLAFRDLVKAVEAIKPSC
ncbi:MAG: serine hydrolase domain-containing protein [Bacteroidales bacterium]